MALQIVAKKSFSVDEIDIETCDSEDIEDCLASLQRQLECPPKLPTTAAEMRREYLLRDYGIQTDQTEILDIKHLQDLSEALVTDLHDLRTDAALTEKHIMIHQEQHMKREIEKITVAHDGVLTQLKRDYNTRVERIRRSTRQELADAIAQIKGEFMAWHDTQMATAQTQILQDTGDGRSHSLTPGMVGVLNAQQENQKLMAQVAMLQEELEAANNKEPQVIVDNSAVEAAERESRKIRNDLEMAQALNNKQDLQIKKLEKTNQEQVNRIKSLEVLNQNSENKIKELDTAIKDIQKRMQIERLEAAKKMLEVKEQMEQRLRDQEEDFKVIENGLKAQLHDLDVKLKKTEKALSASSAAMASANAEAKKAAELAKKNAEMQNKLNQQKNQKKEPVDNIEGFSAEAMKVINELKKRLERLEKMYKRETEILTAQMHALKDESFIRSQLERDALLLHKVDLRYASNNSKRMPHQVPNSQLAPVPGVVNELHRLLNLPKIKLPGEALPEISSSRPKTTPAQASYSSVSLELSEERGLPRRRAVAQGDDTDGVEINAFEAS